MEFYMNLQDIGGNEFFITVKGLVIYINEDSIRRITTLPKGLQWSKEERKEAITANKGFLLQNEQLDEDNNGVRRESMSGPCNDVAY